MISLLETQIQVEIEVSEEDDTQFIYQLSSFGAVTESDIIRTKYLLAMNKGMIDAILDHEFSMRNSEGGLSEYDMSGAEGRAKRLHATDLISNVTANTVILKDSRHELYVLYKKISSRVQFAISTIPDPHEALIAKLLFIDGLSHGKAQARMERLNRKDIDSIRLSAFSDKRRRAIKTLANALQMNRTLDYVVIEKGLGRDKDGECRLVMNL